MEIDLRRATTIGLVVLIVLVAGAGFYLYGESAPSPDQEPDSIRASNEGRTINLARGRRLYRRHCQTCHGRTGRADGPAAKFLGKTDPLNFHSDTAARYSNRELFRKITEGNPSTGMPPWKGTLSVKDRKTVVRYLRNRFIEGE